MSCFPSVEDSPVVYSNCGLRGHSRRTCTGTIQKTAMIKVGETETEMLAGATEVGETETEKVNRIELRETETGVLAAAVPVEDMPEMNA